MVMHGADTDDDLEYHPPTREEVLAKLEDWRRRLHALYADIISWLPAGESYETEIRDYIINEGPMRNVGVPAQPVPELRIFRHGQLCLTFTSDACWIIGAAGRINIFHSDRRFRPDHLVLSDRYSVEPEWRFFPSDFFSLLAKSSDRLSLLRGAPFSQERLLDIAKADHG